MLTNELFNTDYERRLQEGAVDRLEQRRIDDLNMKMDDLARRAKEATDPAHKAALAKDFMKCKDERDSYYKVKTNEGSMKHMMHKDAERMSREAFCEKYGDEHGEFWDNIMGELDEAGIGHDIVNKQEKMSRATPQTKTGAVASTVKNAAKWLAGKGGPGKEGPTYEGANDIEDRGEYDREGDMAKDNIHTIVRNARELESVISDDDNLPEWVQDKLANIKGMMTAVSEYMQTQHERDSVVPEGTETQWSKEEPWRKVPKNKAGQPVDPRGEVAHLSDVARREAERKAQAQKKNPKEVAEHGGGIGPKQHWQDLMPEGWQDFNKVEPYAVCLAGKPVKKFDYYEDARRFHDNWKKKLYREGDKAKAEKITLMPLNLDEGDRFNDPIGYNAATSKAAMMMGYNRFMDVPDRDLDKVRALADKIQKEKHRTMHEAGSPAQQAAIAINMKKHHQKPKHMDEDIGSWIVYDPVTKQIKKRFKTHTAGKSYAQKHGLGFASSEYYFDNIKPAVTADQVNESTGIHPKLVAILKQRGYKGPYKLSKLPKWLSSLSDIADGNDEIMVTGNDPEYDAWVVYNAYGPYAFGQEMGYQTGTVTKVIKDTAPLDEAQTDYQKRRQRERDIDAGKPVARQRQPRQTDYQKRRAQDKKDMELGEEKTRLDPKCWKGKKIGTPKTKVKGGVRVNNCVPAESVNEDQDTSAVESAIIRRIMVAHTDWLQKFGPEKVMQAAEEVAYNVGDVDEIGTSDVSAYVHEVGQILGAT